MINGKVLKQHRSNVWVPDYKQNGTSLPLAPFSGEPGDRLQAGQDKPSPGTPLRGDYMEDKKAFPWHPSRGKQGTDYI